MRVTAMSTSTTHRTHRQRRRVGEPDEVDPSEGMVHTHSEPLVMRS